MSEISFRSQVDDGGGLIDYEDNLTVEFIVKPVPDVSELMTLARKLEPDGRRRLLHRLAELGEAVDSDNTVRAVRLMLKIVESVKYSRHADIKEFRHRCDDLLQQLIRNVRINDRVLVPEYTPGESRESYHPN